jgi:uncharacterized protein (DUF111 family)
MNLPGGYPTDTVARIETNLDDLSPEISGAVMDKLFAAGALDVWFTPVHMKKNRAGVMLSLLCPEDAVGRLSEIVLMETSAFGLRIDQVTRLKLERRFDTVRTEFGNVTVKLGLKGAQVLQVAPEFESCREASERNQVPLRAVYDAARIAWKEQFSGNGT